MWLLTRARTEYDKKTLVNLDHYSTITMSQLGERWFIDSVMATDTVTLASVDSHDEAIAIVRSVFDAIKNGITAVDLNV